MDAARLAWDTPASRSSYLPSPYLLPPLAAPSGLCLPLPFAVVLLCCWFCFVLLLLCLPGLGSCVLSPPSLPPFSFLRSACFLCAPLPVLCLCGFTLVSLLFCCGWLSLFRSSFPLPACACVCENVLTLTFFLADFPDTRFFCNFLSDETAVFWPLESKNMSSNRFDLTIHGLMLQRSFMSCRDAVWKGMKRYIRDILPLFAGLSYVWNPLGIMRARII